MVDHDAVSTSSIRLGPLCRTSFWALPGIAALALLAPGCPPGAVGAQRSPQTELVGLTVASHLAAIAAEQPGTIVDMPVREGDRIKKGDALFALSSRLQQLEVDRLRALVESDLEQSRATATLQNARDKVQRMRELSQLEISAVAALEEVELQSELAGLSLRKAEFERELVRNDLLQAEERLAQRALHSPLDGVVTRRFKQLGETTEQLIPVVEVMSINPLNVEFECPVVVERRFPIGGFVRVRPAIGDHEPRLAEITHVSLQARPASHAFLVRASLPNPDYSWRSGLKVFIEAVDAPSATPPEGK